MPSTMANETFRPDGCLVGTNFEFLPRASRRIVYDWKMPILFVSVVFITGIFGLYIKETAAEFQSKYDSEAHNIEVRANELTEKALRCVPDSKILLDLENEIKSHNFSLIGPRTSWGELFQAIESELPEGAVIAKIENSKSGAQIFPAGENEFRLQVIVSDSDTANAFYRRISTRKAFQSLSFTPKGEQSHGGRKGIAVEISFRFAGLTS